MRHDLKIWPQQFMAVLGDQKKHEVRVNDRDFRESDEIMLKEWDPNTKSYTGRHILTKVTNLTEGGTFGLPKNLVVMTIQVQWWDVSATA